MIEPEPRQWHLRWFPLAKRFWFRVDSRSEDECWLWKGTQRDGGYGAVRVNGTGDFRLGELVAVPNRGVFGYAVYIRTSSQTTKGTRMFGGRSIGWSAWPCIVVKKPKGR